MTEMWNLNVDETENLKIKLMFRCLKSKREQQIVSKNGRVQEWVHEECSQQDERPCEIVVASDRVHIYWILNGLSWAKRKVIVDVTE